MALFGLGRLSEARIQRYLNERTSNLPGFLVKEGGLNSGFMIAQCTDQTKNRHISCLAFRVKSARQTSINWLNFHISKPRRPCFNGRLRCSKESRSARKYGIHFGNRTDALPSSSGPDRKNPIEKTVPDPSESSLKNPLHGIRQILWSRDDNGKRDDNVWTPSLVILEKKNAKSIKFNQSRT